MRNLYRRLLDNGYTPIPIKPGAKSPGALVGNEWVGYSKWSDYLYKGVTYRNTDAWEAWAERSRPDGVAPGAGLLTGRLIAIDVDVTHPELADDVIALVRRVLGDLPCRVGLPPKRLYIGRIDHEWNVAHKRRSKVFKVDDHDQQCIEVLGAGQQFVAYGVHPKTGRPYEWLLPNHNPLWMKFDDLPTISTEQIDTLLAAFDELAQTVYDGDVVSRGMSEREATSKDKSDLEDKRGDIQDALKHIKNNDLHYDDWVKIGHAIKAAVPEEDVARELFHEFSEKSAKYDYEQTDKRFDTFQPKEIGAGTLYRLAKQGGWISPEGRFDPSAPEFVEIEDDEIERWLESGMATGALDEGDTDPLEDGSWAEGGSVAPGPKTAPETRPAAGGMDAGGGTAASSGLAEGEGLKPDVLPLEANLPPRKFLLGTHLLRGKVTTLVAPGGVGKSTLTIGWALSLASGRDVVHATPHETTGCAIVNNEDESDEVARRMYAAAHHYDIDIQDVSRRVHVFSSRRMRLLIRQDGRLKMTKRVPELIEYLKAREIGALIVDPLVSTHEANENDNGEMEKVMEAYRLIAARANVAVCVVHHTNKPPGGSSEGFAGNANSARGATAVVNASRVAVTLYDMSEKDAKKYGVDESDRGRWVRLDDAKANLSLRSGEPRWFRRETVTLPNGDEVGVLQPSGLVAREREELDSVLDALGEWAAFTPEQPVTLREAVAYLQKEGVFDAKISDAGGIKKLAKHFSEAVEFPEISDKRNLSVWFEVREPDKNRNNATKWLVCGLS